MPTVSVCMEFLTKMSFFIYFSFTVVCILFLTFKDNFELVSDRSWDKCSLEQCSCLLTSAVWLKLLPPPSTEHRPVSGVFLASPQVSLSVASPCGAGVSH